MYTWKFFLKKTKKKQKRTHCVLRSTNVEIIEVKPKIQLSQEVDGVNITEYNSHSFLMA